VAGVMGKDHLLVRVAASAALVALVVALSLALLPSSAAAHALLIRSSPGVDATVAQSPAQILLTFSEPVDPTLSKVQVFDAHGRTVSGVSRSQPVTGNQQQLRVVLASPLAHGVYTIEWQTVSALDGHFAGGTYAFGVGVANIGAVAPFGKFVSTATWLTAVAAAGRWLLLAGLALLLGAASTCWLVLRGRLPGGGLLLLRIGWLLAAVGVSTVILSERAIVRAPSLLPLFETHEGLLLLGLAAAVLIFCGVAVVAVGVVPRPATFVFLGLATATAMFVLIWAGHANGASPWRAFTLAGQWLHVAAVGVWIGGLPWLLLALRGPNGLERTAAVRRFSLIASIALGVVVLTGLSRAVAEVGAPANLIHTSFGRTLLVKLALFGALLALAALNHFILVPTLGGGAVGLQSFRRTVRGEVVLGVAILAVTGVLSGQAPARFAAAAAQAGTASHVVLTGTDYATTARVRLTVSPGAVGRNEFAAAVSDYGTGKPLAGVRRVELDFSLPSQTKVQPSTLALSRGPDGVWRAAGLELSVAGRWSIGVLVQEATTSVVVPLSFTARLPGGP
jgi:copper transport protein